MAEQPAEATAEQRTAEARNAFLGSLHAIGSHGDAALQARAADIQSNAAVLAKQEAEVAKQTEALARQTTQFQQLADESRGKLKEIGDVQNWAEMIQGSLLVLEETMRIVEGEEEVQGQSAEQDGKGKKRSGWWW
jgi:hypothetical protein